MNEEFAVTMSDKLDPQPPKPPAPPFVKIRKQGHGFWGTAWRWELYLANNGPYEKSGRTDTRWGAIRKARKALEKVRKEREELSRQPEFVKL